MPQTYHPGQELEYFQGYCERCLELSHEFGPKGQQVPVVTRPSLSEGQNNWDSFFNGKQLRTKDDFSTWLIQM